MAWCQRSPRGCHPWPIEASLTSCISAGCTGTVSWKLENMETIGNPNVFLGPSGRTSWCRLQGVDLCQLLCPGDGESDEVGREKWGGMEQVRSDPWQHFAQRNLLKMIRFTKNNGKNFHIDYFHYFYNSKVFHYFSNPVFHGLFHGSFLYYALLVWQSILYTDTWSFQASKRRIRRGEGWQLPQYFPRISVW